MAIPSGYTILKLPQWTFFLRIAQAVVALVIFGLVCYGESIASFDSDGLMLFTGISTFITLAYILVSQFFVPQAYNFWAVLALECFAVLFWLVSFALLASEVNQIRCLVFACFDSIYYKRSLVGTANTFYNTMAAAAGLGGLEFVLFVITLVVVSLYVHRERVGAVGEDPAKPTESAAVETQAAPQIPAISHPRDLEEEMIENENRRNSLRQEQTPQLAEERETSAIEHAHQGRGEVEGQDVGGARQQFHIEV